ncbi:MAG: 3-methyl-2-oxobutanoate hydroxymethyltransferase [Campylobacteraceae bacterium]|jgi:3-methyl-2-oxobutanoate hydroxymethyltransferase|nr:3-methyl-2-oxobutanoate hydroxymethyltransferase [Campylobacteraceae bacterium]
MIKTITSIKNAKNSEKLVVITAYDALFARLFDEKVDMILVGDSLNNSFNGQKDTLSADLEMMIYHTKAVLRGAKNTFVITDMPFASYIDEKTALKNASKIYQQTDAHAVKIEGGKERAHIVKALSDNSIAVVGHIGLMPQFARSEGGFKVKGKDETDTQTLIDDAKAIEDAGAFCIVIEGVKEEAGRAITEAVKIPTIGIGAGRYTDGQVLVWSDMLGFFEEFKPKFVKRYLDGADLVKKAVEQYANDVKNRKFPDNDFIY